MRRLLPRRQMPPPFGQCPTPVGRCAGGQPPQPPRLFPPLRQTRRPQQTPRFDKADCSQVPPVFPPQWPHPHRWPDAAALAPPTATPGQSPPPKRRKTPAPRPRWQRELLSISDVRRAYESVTRPAFSTPPDDSCGSGNSVRRSHLPIILLTQPIHWPARAQLSPWAARASARSRVFENR